MALHHHIARHTKKYVSHVTKYLYERDTFFATIAVFVFLILLGMIPLNFYVLNPMKLALKLSLIHISEPTRLLSISYVVFCLKKKNIQIYSLAHRPTRHINL